MDKAPRTARRSHKLLAIALGAAAASAALAPAPAAAQGFFDFLFGNNRPAYQDQSYQQSRPIVAYAPDPGYTLREAPRRQKRVAAKPKPLDEITFTSKPEKKDPPPMGQGPLGAFLNDPTLQPGDVVVTEKGLMVYRGDGGSSHRNKDFVGLAQARTLAKADRNVLASIEKANRSAPQIQVIADAKPAEGEAVLQQASIETAPARKR